MKRHIIFLAAIAAFFSSATLSHAQVSFGKSSLFNDNWLFIQEDVQNGSDANLDDSKWTRLNVPHDWSVKGVLSPDKASSTGYLPAGKAWYRKHFSGRRLTSEQVYIYFEGVYNRSTVYLNGHKLGYRPSGYNSFMYDMTPYLNREGDNVLAVSVDHSMIADSRWYPGSGIYRNVWTVQAGNTHFAQWGIGYNAVSVNDRQAVLRVDTAIEGLKGGEMVSLVLKDASGKVAGKTTAKASSSQNIDLKVAKPHRWDITDPYLYTLEASIISGKDVLDRAEVKVGIRTLDFNANTGFALNGRNMKVKGVCLHHDAGVLGAAVPDKLVRTRLLALKSIGANAIRTSHNPQAPVFYDLCDEIGLLVMDEAYDEWEFNKKKWVAGWNKGVPAMDGTADYFEEWCETDVTDMVRRDRNHPSVFLWSIGNEVDYPNDPYSHPILNGDNFEFTQPLSGGFKPDAPRAERIGDIAKKLTACVHAVDMSRPVTGALAGVVMSNQTEYPEAVDVVGYNYTESRYEKDHATYPGRILYGSENRHDYAAWKAVRDNEFIFGQFLWTGADYLGEAGAWPSRGSGAGLLDLKNEIKPRGHFRAALWLDTPVCYIGTTPKRPMMMARPGFTMRDSSDAPDTWNYEEGQMIRVVCYTNAAQARLLLNGKEVGAMQPFNEETAIIGWDVPYSAGVLKAEGFDKDGNKVSEYEIHSSLRPSALAVCAAETDVEAGEVSEITLQIVDDNGKPVTLGDNLISCTVEGPAQLLGLESGNMTDVTPYTAGTRRAYKGRIKAYVKTDNMPGKVTVKFSSPLIKGAEVEISSHRYTKTEDIRLSDPFILADDATGMYYMTGTGGMLWRSKDLRVWDGPFRVAQTDSESWMGPRPMIWAAELHKYNGKYYYFATFTNQSEFIGEYRGNKIERRACHVLVSDTPDGPYVPMADKTYLPADQPTLDATLWVEDGKPYMLFCHEWLQNWNGTVEKIRLKDDFSGTAGERTLLFTAFDSPWSREKHEDGSITPNKVTDGPFVFKTKTGKLGMIWTSWKFSEYTQGVAYSASGKLDGPWIQEKNQITPPNYGHGMIFRTFDGKLILCCHSHDKVNGATVRIPAYFLLDDSGDKIKVIGRY